MTESETITPEDEQFDEIAEEAMSKTVALAKAMILVHQNSGEDPNEYCDAVLWGMMDGIVHSMFRVTKQGMHGDAVERLREMLDDSIKLVAVLESLPDDGATIQ